MHKSNNTNTDGSGGGSSSTTTSSTNAAAAAAAAGGRWAPSGQMVAALNNAAAIGLSSAIYRGPLNHGSTAELQEGFRVLTNGQKQATATLQDMYNAMQSVGLHTSEEELQELIRVVHQDERTCELDFAEFLQLMTKEVDETMIEEMCSAFEHYDPAKTGFVQRKQFTEMLVTMGERSSAEELDELLLFADSTNESELIDYRKFVTDLAMRASM